MNERSPKPVPGHMMVGTVRQIVRQLAVTGLLACCAVTVGRAQNSALARVALFAPLLEYTANESGGRIAMANPRGDSQGVETIRLHLLESAAAIRRGDFRSVRVIRTDLPAIQVLTDRRASIRCLFRPSPRGGELVLWSDDDFVVAAIHQVLARPPRARVRL